MSFDLSDTSVATAEPDSASLPAELDYSADPSAQQSDAAGDLNAEDALPEAGEQTDGEQPEQNAALESLIEEAGHKGIPAELAQSMGDKLPEYLALMDKQAVALLRGQLQSEAPPQEQEAAPAAQQQQPPAAEPVLPLGKLSIELDPDAHDEEIIKAHSATAEQVNKLQEMVVALAELAMGTHGTVETFQKKEQEQTVSTEEREWDGVFASLGEEYAAIYGKAPVKQLTVDSPLLKERIALVEEARLLKKVDEKAKRPIQTTQEYARRALAYLKSEKVAEAARSDVQKKLATSRKAAIAKPSARNARVPDARQKALATIKRYTDQMGL